MAMGTRRRCEASGLPLCPLPLQLARRRLPEPPPPNVLPQVALLAIRPVPEASEVYQGVAAPKRKRVEEQPVLTEIPKVRTPVLPALDLELPPNWTRGWT